MGEKRRTNRLCIGLLCSFFFLFACVSSRISPEEAARLEGDLTMLLVRSMRHFREGTPEAWERAKAALEIAYELNASDPRVLDGLGCVAVRFGDFEKAKKYFQAALREDQAYERAYVHLAFVAEEQGDYESAEELLRVAIILNPLNYRARNNLAAVQMEFGGQQGLERSYRELLRASQGAGEDSVIHYNLSRFKFFAEGKTPRRDSASERKTRQE